MHTNPTLQYILITDCVLGFRHDKLTVYMSMILTFVTMIVVFRLALLRSIESDKATYRLYMLLYNLQLTAACVSLRS
jgi:formate hydrogenlyase subunit 3/multisubunit Na+/H+ antiporter MnhD subunit